jgi:hypothetical protein
MGIKYKALVIRQDKQSNQFLRSIEDPLEMVCSSWFEPNLKEQMKNGTVDRPLNSELQV